VGKRTANPRGDKGKFKDLQKVSKACVDTIGEGIDAYRMMSTDLEARVNGLFHKIDLMIDTLNQNTT
jgi:hypothetical protein